MNEIGKKSLNGKIADCEHCDIKHTFKVCSGRCTTKQTAVEWLIEQLFELRNPTLNQIEILKQAKEIEKQQIIASYKMGRYDSDKIVMSETFYSEQYYNETFKNK